MAEFLGPDFFHDTPARVMGSETEFSIQRKLLPDLKDIEAIVPYIRRYSSLNRSWARNGGKLYYDSAHHLDTRVAEYATPECLGASELVLYEKAGEYLVHLAAVEATNGIIDPPLYKRSAYSPVVDRNGVLIMHSGSLGHHENYSTPLTWTQQGDERALVSYLATRPLWAGAGIVTGRGFSTWQKADAVTYLPGRTNYTEHGHKVPLRNRADYVEIRCGDGNMSPWAIRTKFAMTSLVLRLIEHGEFPEAALLPNKTVVQEAAQRSSYDFFSPINPRKPEGLNGVDHQRVIAEAALRFIDTHPNVPADEHQAALDVMGVCTTINERRPFAQLAEQLSDRVDWAAKATYLHQLGRVRIEDVASVTTRNINAVQLDLQWESIGQHTPSDEWYKKTGNIIPEDSVQAALLVAPTSTRAGQRVTITDAYGGEMPYIEWNTVSRDNPLRNIYLPSAYPDYNKIEVEL